MSENKRKFQGEDNKRKKKYRSDGTPVWGRRHVEGPGVWVSCVKGKEKQTVGEIYELFESVGSEIWPPESEAADDNASDDDDDDTGLSLEEQVAKEVSAMKRPRNANPKQRFTNCQTNTPCVLFIACKPPVDPVELVVRYVNTVQETGVTRTRHVHRLVPVSGSCVANIPEIQSLCHRVFANFFDKHPDTKFKYKIELRVRNHTNIPRPTLIQTVAQCVPDGHAVDLDNPEIFILVEVFKSICGISIVKDYYELSKFNVNEIVIKKNRKDIPEDPESRLSHPAKSSAEEIETRDAGQKDSKEEIKEEIDAGISPATS